MDPSRLTELQQLLIDVLPSVVLQMRNSSQLSQGQYRTLLQRCRSVYDPAGRLQLSSWDPLIGRDDLKEQLLAFVNTELSDHIRNGKIQSATFALSGGLPVGYPVDTVVNNIIRRAIVDGPGVAAQAFDTCVSSSASKFHRFFVLSSIRVEEPMTLFDGVTLMPLPNSISELPPYLPLILDPSDGYRIVSTQQLLGKTVARVECEVSPVFCHPPESLALDTDPASDFEMGIRSNDLDNLNIGLLGSALSLACRTSVRPAMEWQSLLDYEIFDFSGVWGIGGQGFSWIRHALLLDKSVTLGQVELQRAQELYKSLSQLSAATLDKLHIPIDRWMTSMEEVNHIDQIIDLGIALESLYVPNPQGDTSLRFTLNASWHLGKNKHERQKLRKDFQEIYSARSDVMHAGRLRGDRAKPSFDRRLFITHAQELCWQGLTSVIEAGVIPDWDNLIMGNSVN